MGQDDISHKDKIFRDSLGQKATVHRETVGLEKASVPNRMLCDLGLKMQEVDTQLKHYKYMGSAAVHIYVSELAGSLVYASQVDPLELYRCPERLAAKAFDDLLGEMKKLYGHRRGKLRSGF